MTKIGKKLAAVLLVVAMVVTFVPVIGTQTAYAADPGEFQNVNITEDGVMTWDAVSNTSLYWVGINGSWVGTSKTYYNLNETIDHWIESGDLEKASSYSISLQALDADYVCLAEWQGTYDYDSPAEPFAVGTIDAAIHSGYLSWSAYEGASIYWIAIDGFSVSTTSTFYELESQVDSMIESGTIENTGSHTITLYANNSSGTRIAEWSGTYEYTYVPLDTTIYEISLSLPEPAEGETAEALSGETDTYTYTVDWKDITETTTGYIPSYVGNVYKKGSTYRASVSVEAKDGYSFAGSVDVKVNGSEEGITAAWGATQFGNNYYIHWDTHITGNFYQVSFQDGGWFRIDARRGIGRKRHLYLPGMRIYGSGKQRV